MVVPVPCGDSGVELHAFCTGKASFSRRGLEDYLREYLPDYMIPSRIHLLQEMPYTTGGKADLVRLRQMAEKEEEETPLKERPVESPATSSGHPFPWRAWKTF